MVGSWTFKSGNGGRSEVPSILVPLYSLVKLWSNWDFKFLPLNPCGRDIITIGELISVKPVSKLDLTA